MGSRTIVSISLRLTSVFTTRVATVLFCFLFCAQAAGVPSTYWRGSDVVIQITPWTSGRVGCCPRSRMRVVVAVEAVVAALLVVAGLHFAAAGGAYLGWHVAVAGVEACARRVGPGVFRQLAGVA